jgi:hypothetical protein
MTIDPRANRRRAILKSVPELGASMYRESLRDEEQERVARYFRAGEHIGNLLAFVVWIVKLPFLIILTLFRHIHEVMLLSFLAGLGWIIFAVVYIVGITKGWW